MTPFTESPLDIELVDRDRLEIHPLDADRLWISDGDKVIAVDVRPMAEQPAFTPVLTPVG